MKLQHVNKVPSKSETIWMKNGVCEFGSILKVEGIIFGSLRVLKKIKRLYEFMAVFDIS